MTYGIWERECAVDNACAHWVANNKIGNRPNVEDFIEKTKHHENPSQNLRARNRRGTYDHLPLRVATYSAICLL